MNLSVNQSPKQPQPPKNPPSESAKVLSKPPTPEIVKVKASRPATPAKVKAEVSQSTKPEEVTAEVSQPSSDESSQRQHPIPPPSSAKQYRAIGLIQGQYQPSEEQLTRGSLVTEDGTTIEAVLLGRVISLVKNHLDLEQSHLWVVYPRTRQEDGNLHVQLVGVWEPETLAKSEATIEATPEATVEGTPEVTVEETPEVTTEGTSEVTTEGTSEVTTEATPEATIEETSEVTTEGTSEVTTEATPEATTEETSEVTTEATSEATTEGTSEEKDEKKDDLNIEHGYFSIRGEAIYYSKDDEKIVIKIKQAPRKESEKAKFFKLDLKGTFSSPKAIHHFWDFQVQLEGNTLKIQEATDKGAIPVKRHGKKKRFSKGPKKKFSSSDSRPSSQKEGVPKKPVSKPVKKKAENESASQ